MQAVQPYTPRASAVQGYTLFPRLWHHGPCKHALQRTPISRSRSANFICSSQVVFTLGGFALGGLLFPPSLPPPRLPEFAIDLPQVVQHNHRGFRKQVVCSVPLLKGHPPERGLFQDRERRGKARGLLSKVATDVELKHHWVERKSSPGVYSSELTLRPPQAPKHRRST